MFKYLFVFFFLTTCAFLIHAQTPSSETHSTKIGLTLSGGGARGLAHIGILKAIDSAGLKVDYITGTSMGSIIGGLYAAGYSGDSIEQIAKAMDWNVLLSNYPPLTDITIEEKFEYGRYAIELPFYKGKPHLPNGLIESEELWLKFSELFFPVCHIKDFTQFPIPFKCIGTDIETGKAIILDRGEIAQAVRSSMAIPSVFAPVPYDTLLLTDGGVVHNFPVDEVIGMGAEYVIGVDISTPQLKNDQINSLTNVMMQIAFYKDADDIVNEIKKCNTYIRPDLQDYTSGDFDLGDYIIDIGIKEGLKYYPFFKKLADSLNAHVTKEEIENRLPKKNLELIENVYVSGLKKTDEKFFLGKLDIKKEAYSTYTLSESIRRVYGTRYYKKMTFKLVRNSNNKSDMFVEVVEQPQAFVKGAIHYDSYNDASFIFNLTLRNFLLKGSRILGTMNLGKYPKLRLEHYQYVGRKRNYGLGLEYYAERSHINQYDSTYRAEAEYTIWYQHIMFKAQIAIKRKMLFGGAIRREFFVLKPKVANGLYVKGANSFNYLFAYIKYNTLDRRFYSRKGTEFYIEGGQIFDQRVKLIYIINGKEFLNSDTLDLQGLYNNYQKIYLKFRKFVSISKRSVIQASIYGGYIINSKAVFFNFYGLGGLYEENRNQIPFVGILNYQVTSPNIATASIGYQYELTKNVFANIKANVATYDFYLDDLKTIKNFVSGAGIGLNYMSALGPIDIYGAYSPETKKAIMNINIGFYF